MACCFVSDGKDEAAEWFDGASISEADRLKIGRLNALKLFGIASHQDRIEKGRHHRMRVARQEESST